MHLRNKKQSQTRGQRRLSYFKQNRRGNKTGKETNSKVQTREELLHVDQQRI